MADIIQNGWVIVNKYNDPIWDTHTWIKKDSIEAYDTLFEELNWGKYVDNKKAGEVICRKVFVEKFK